ncbi:MAG TPA: Crp/Fnr family transcriptional regulator [Anaerolineae bacterium]|nr:Crp/Fnr family transcriptional regulator [Anaerolineae bacterium]
MKRLSATQSEKLSAVQNNRYFSAVDIEILNDLIRHMALFQFDRGETLFLEDEPSKGLYILRKGSVKLYKLSPQGREMVMKVFQEGATFNEVPVFDGGGNPVNVAALEKSSVWIIDASAIRKALREHPEISAPIILNLSKNLRMFVEMVEELSFFQVSTRLARLIISLSDQELAGRGSHRLTQNAIAARLGTVREVVARSLRELERSGAIRASREGIEILDQDRLSEWANQG